MSDLDRDIEEVVRAALSSLDVKGIVTEALLAETKGPRRIHVEPHLRGGHHVEGYWREIDGPTMVRRYADGRPLTTESSSSRRHGSGTRTHHWQFDDGRTVAIYRKRLYSPEHGEYWSLGVVTRDAGASGHGWGDHRAFEILPEGQQAMPARDVPVGTEFTWHGNRYTLLGHEDGILRVRSDEGESGFSPEHHVQVRGTGKWMMSETFGHDFHGEAGPFATKATAEAHALSAVYHKVNIGHDLPKVKLLEPHKEKPGA